MRQSGSDGGGSRRFYPGADDNAAAVAILVDVAERLAKAPPAGRGVIFAAFDAEEPPHFLTGAMGSAWYARHAKTVGPPLDEIDLMVCMDLVGHALGPAGLPSAVGSTVFALGAERSTGTAALVDEIAEAEPGVIVRRADARVIPPLSDYDAFWKREVPFLFLTGGRSVRYHTPEDAPEHLAWDKIAATARWLERFVRRTCARSDARIAFLRDATDDASTLASIGALLAPLAPTFPLARDALARAKELLAACDRHGALPSALAEAPAALLLGIERALS